MAAPASLPALLDLLQNSISSALEITPKLADIEPTKGGISLFDIKNELLLSYLQNLVFLILLKLRQAKDSKSDSTATEPSLDDLVVKKLVELRLYLERGVRPLEDKLRYQVEKVLRAATDSERTARAVEAKTQTNGRGSGVSGSASVSDSEDSDREERDGNGEEEDVAGISALHNRPNISAMVRANKSKSGAKEKNEGAPGVYRPPRLNPTVMPTTSRREKAERKPHKSATLDEFIADEMSTAPLAMPSIGTTITAGGRKHKTAAEQREEQERRDYEEAHFVRLPKESKKDRAKKANLTGRSGRMQFGGEEWRELGEGVDRINRLTKARSSGTGTKALLEKSRKRGLDTTDGPRGSGSTQGGDMGERYQKRLKVLQGGRRDRSKKR